MLLLRHVKNYTISIYTLTENGTFANSFYEALSTNTYKDTKKKTGDQNPS